ncbi:MAG: glycosyltransferase [Sandaracinaceae bacterium]|nr:glycosyltransferase [Sandaracinaceae bacterium]
MNTLHVIHGYPPFYMAGSEVYTRNLCRALARESAVHVFTRVENPFAPPYSVTTSREDGVEVTRVNKPARDYTLEDKYLDARVDDVFRETVARVRPDVVHIGHLSHLSTNLPIIAKRELGLPVVHTVHDFWLHCVRGQLVRADLAPCQGPSDDACTRCLRDTLKHHASLGATATYRTHMQDVLEHIDRFLVPSRTVGDFLIQQGVDPDKVIHWPYGLDVSRIVPRVSGRLPRETVRFGFMGRVIPVKGIGLLLEAFREVRGDVTLEVWGQANGSLPWLRALSGDDPRVTFRGGYEHDDLAEVLSRFDVLVAPSLWLENSPLVIQEALAAGIPIITSDAGGMAELVDEGRHGFRVPLGDRVALRDRMQTIADEPSLLDALSPSSAPVRTIEDDAASCGRLYRSLTPKRRLPQLAHRPSPWRVTFVTNPGTCNLACAMCDTHSPHAPPRKHGLPTLSFDVIDRTVRALVRRGLREIIPSTMGEPLLYKELDKVLDLALETGVRVNLTTNGTFPVGGVERWAPALLPVVSDVKFSVNATSQAVADVVMEGLDVQRQLEDIARYIRERDAFVAGGGRRSTVTLQCTLMEATLPEMPGILRWSIDHGVDRLKAHHLWVTWPQLRGQSLRRSAVDAGRWSSMSAELEQIAEAALRERGVRVRLENLGPLPLGNPGGPAEDSVCPFLGQEAWVEADGSFQVCCCPSEKRAAFGYFGSLTESSLEALWNGEAYAAFLGSWGDHPHCVECNMRRPRQGGAR